jgi:G3E family GTPase
VKRILNNTVGLKVLVIENEIGAEGIDHELLMQSVGKDEIVLLSNGCICCTGKIFGVNDNMQFTI